MPTKAKIFFFKDLGGKLALSEMCPLSQKFKIGKIKKQLFVGGFSMAVCLTMSLEKCITQTPVDIVQSILQFLKSNHVVLLESTGNRKFVDILHACRVQFHFDADLVMQTSHVTNLMRRFIHCTELKVGLDTLVGLDLLIESLPNTLTHLFLKLSCDALHPIRHGHIMFPNHIQSLNLDIPIYKKMTIGLGIL
jgi:hypothetical protein